MVYEDRAFFAIMQFITPVISCYFFMLNSTEHKIYHAHIMLIKVKMPTIVGSLTFIRMINTTSERLLYMSVF